MLFTNTANDLSNIINIINNIDYLCVIESEKIEGTKNKVEININYHIKDKYVIILTKKYPTMTYNKFEDLFDEFLNEADNSIYVNLYYVYRVLIGELKDDYIINWIKAYFYHKKDALKIFNELHQ